MHGSPIAHRPEVRISPQLEGHEPHYAVCKYFSLQIVHKIGGRPCVNFADDQKGRERCGDQATKPDCWHEHKTVVVSARANLGPETSKMLRRSLPSCKDDHALPDH